MGTSPQDLTARAGYPEHGGYNDYPGLAREEHDALTLNISTSAASAREDKTGPRTNTGLMATRLKPYSVASLPAAFSARTCQTRHSLSRRALGALSGTTETCCQAGLASWGPRSLTPVETSRNQVTQWKAKA